MSRYRNKNTPPLNVVKDQERAEEIRRTYEWLGVPHLFRPELWSRPVGGTLPRLPDPSIRHGYFD